MFSSNLAACLWAAADGQLYRWQYYRSSQVLTSKFMRSLTAEHKRLQSGDSNYGGNEDAWCLAWARMCASSWGQSPASWSIIPAPPAASCSPINTTPMDRWTLWAVHLWHVLSSCGNGRDEPPPDECWGVDIQEVAASLGHVRDKCLMPMTEVHFSQSYCLCLSEKPCILSFICW